MKTKKKINKKTISNFVKGEQDVRLSTIEYLITPQERDTILDPLLKILRERNK